MTAGTKKMDTEMEMEQKWKWNRNGNGNQNGNSVATALSLCHIVLVARSIVRPLQTSVDARHLGASLSERYRLPHGWLIVGIH